MSGTPLCIEDFTEVEAQDLRQRRLQRLSTVARRQAFTFGTHEEKVELSGHPCVGGDLGRDGAGVYGMLQK
jgi:hypothetical protein